MTDADARYLKRLLADEGSSEVCGTLASILRAFGDPKQPEDDAEGERGDWTGDVNKLESISGQFIN